MIKEILADGIFYYKELIPNPSAFIKKIEDLDIKFQNNLTLSNWKPWVSSTRPDDIFGEFKFGSCKKNVSEQFDEESFLIISTIHNAIQMCIDDYSYSTDKDLGFLPDEITIRKYHPGGKMGPHIDCEEDDDNEGDDDDETEGETDDEDEGDGLNRSNGLRV